MNVQHFNRGRKADKPASLSFEDAALLDSGDEVAAMFTLDSDFDLLGMETARALEVAPGVMCFARGNGIELSRARRYS